MTIFERKVEIEVLIASYICFLFSDEPESKALSFVEREAVINEIGELKSELNRLNEMPLHRSNEVIKTYIKEFESSINKN
tara:strand:+ start:7818 stop:8057 length:240 start_codon:yes stop_codon:yes gene_type:complete